jgi:predicted amidohydrolase YtcJ
MSRLLRKTTLIVFGVILLSVSSPAQQVTVPAEVVAYPDLILYNGKVVTMDDRSLSDSTGRTAQAIAVRGDKIQFIGDTDVLLTYAGPQTQRIDLKGRTVVPGIINTHTHLHNGAVSEWAENNPGKVESIRKKFSVGGRSFDDLTRGIELVVKEQMTRPLPGQWAWIGLEGGATGIGVQYIKQDAMTRAELDELAPDLPVILHSHPTWKLNTAARDDFLRMYEVAPTDENEELALTIATMYERGLVVDRYFNNHPDELADVIEDYLSYQLPSGTTTYSSHIVGLSFQPVFIKLAEEGRMPIRFAFSHRNCQQVEPDTAGCWLKMGDFRGLGNKYYWNIAVTIGGIDSGMPAICTSMDASPARKSQEECLLEPGNHYAKAIFTALRSRMRYTVNHAIGDKGMDYVTDIIEQVIETQPGISLDDIRKMRITADHCNFYPRKDQIPHFARLGMMLSCETAINRSTPWLDVYGKDKASQIAPIRSLLDGGVMVSSESGTSPTSGSGLTWTAANLEFITRKNVRGELIAPEEAVNRQELMKMATTWAAHFVLKEDELGSLEPGKYADIVVFNKDYFTVPLEEFPTVYPVMTIMGGEIKVLREEFATELGTDPVGHQIEWEFEKDYDFGEPLDPMELM